MPRISKSTKRTLLPIIVCVLFFCGCGSRTALPEAAKPPEPQQLRIAASESLAPALKEIGAQFEKKNNVKISFIFGATETLLQQIDKGVAVDVIAVTDVQLIEQLNTKGKIISDTLESYAPQKLAVAAIKGATGERPARRFIQYMNETEGQVIMKKFGFTVPATR